MSGPHDIVMRNPLPESATLDWDAIYGASRPAAAIHRYPLDIGSPPHEKQMLFEVKKARHLGRRSMVGEGEAKDSTVATAVMYMPADALNSTTTVDWSPEEIGIVGGAAMQAFAEGGTTTSENIMEKLGAAGIAGAKGLALDTIAKMTTKGLGFVTGGGNGKAILESMFGQKIDPRTDMLFSGVQYRRHQFSFTLIPRSQEEAESINQILNIFQFYMLPKYGGGDKVTTDSFFIGYPYEFDITMITGSGDAKRTRPSPHINKIDRSVLTGCNINHAGGQRVAFMGNYYPAATSLVMDFTEVRLQGRDSYDASMHHGTGSRPSDPNGVFGLEEGMDTLNKIKEGATTSFQSASSGIESVFGVQNPNFMGPRQQQ